MKSRWLYTAAATLLPWLLNPTAAAKTTVTFWHVWGNGDDIGQSFLRTAEEFEKRNPDIDIEVVDGGSLQKLTVAVAGGAPPDAVIIDERISSYAISNLLEPLSDFFRRDGLKPEDFWLPSYRETVWDGQVWAISWGSDPNFGFFWNRTAFAEVGLDPNRPPETIPELDQYNRKLVRAEGGKLVRFGIVPWNVYGFPNSMYTWGWAFGGEFYDIERRKVTADDPPNVRALDWMASYAREYGFDRVSALGGGPGAFVDGRITMAPFGPWELPRIRRLGPDLDFSISFVPYDPQDGQPNPTWVGGHKIIIPRGAKNREAAWRWIKFIAADPVGSAILAQPINWFPAYKRSQIYETYRRDRYLAPYVRLLETARHQRPVMPAAEDYWKELDRAVNAVLRGQKPAREALTEVTRVVQQKLDEILAKQR